jgi:hypothetical protein
MVQVLAGCLTCLIGRAAPEPSVSPRVEVVMKLIQVALVAGFLLGGCSDPRAPARGTGPVANSPERGAGRLLTRPATQDARRPVFKAVDLRSGVYLARLETRTTITPDGLMRSVLTTGKSYGPNDLDPKHERREIREGRLTPGQMAELAALFAGWESLSDQEYGGVPDGGHVQIRYGDKSVSGGSAVPKQVRDVQIRISELAATMPVVAE